MGYVVQILWGETLSNNIDVCVSWSPVGSLAVFLLTADSKADPR